MNNGKKNKKIFDIVLDVFAWLSFLLAVIMAVATIFAALSDQNVKEVFGARLLIVKTDSMSKPPLVEEQIYFNSGDLILIKQVKDASALKEGDVIAFISYNPDSYGQVVTHKIREVKYSAAGRLVGYVTYGIRTGENDQTVVQPESVIGVFSGKIAYLGNVFAFLKTPRGFYLSIMVPAVLLIIFFSIKVGRIIGRKEAISNYKKEAISLKEKTYSQAKILEKNEFDIKASSKLTQKQRAIDLSKKPNGRWGNIK